MIKFPIFKRPTEFPIDIQFPEPGSSESKLSYEDEITTLLRHLFQNKHPKLRSTVTILSEEENQVFFQPAENFNFGNGSGYVKMTSEDGNYFQGYLREWSPKKGIMISNRGEVGAGSYV